MMTNEYYQTIFKRKSFHLFRNVGSEKVSEAELAEIENAFSSFERLYPDIKTAIRIVPTSVIKGNQGAEYCILLYSEKAPNYLLNIGYIGEQLDLYLVENNIGSLWYGIGKPDQAIYDGLDFVIMFAIHKISDESKYRKDLFKAKRKDLDSIWTGDTLGVAEIARFAPSACNSQPWIVNNADNRITISRNVPQGRVGIMPPKTANYFNRIDMGIFLCVLEICMAEKGICATRTLYLDNSSNPVIPIAAYSLE